jgi:hypothetical protein
VCYELFSSQQLQRFSYNCCSNYILPTIRFEVVPLQSKEKMAKKMILNRARAIPTNETPSVSKDDIAPSSSRNIPALETAEQLPFRILDET